MEKFIDELFFFQKHKARGVRFCFVSILLFCVPQYLHRLFSSIIFPFRFNGQSKIVDIY